MLTEARGVSSETAGVYVTAYWGALLAGRILSGFIVERIGTVRLVRLGTMGAMVGAALLAPPGAPHAAAGVGLVLVGLAIAPIFPGLMSETPRRVGAESAPHAIGFQIAAAAAGVAFLPNVAGLLAEWRGLGAVPVFLAVSAATLFALHELLMHVADGRRPE